MSYQTLRKTHIFELIYLTNYYLAPNLIAIIEKIATQKGVGISKRETSYFDGDFYRPIRHYNLEFPVKKGNFTINAENREPYSYIWNLSMRTSGVNHDFIVSKSFWFERKLFKKPPIKVKSQDQRTINFLSSSKAIHNLYFGQKENVDCLIKGKYEKGHFTVWIELYPEYELESLPFAAIAAMEEINSFLTAEDF